MVVVKWNPELVSFSSCSHNVNLGPTGPCTTRTSRRTWGSFASRVVPGPVSAARETCTAGWRSCERRLLKHTASPWTDWVKKPLSLRPYPASEELPFEKPTEEDFMKSNVSFDYSKVGYLCKFKEWKTWNDDCFMWKKLLRCSEQTCLRWSEAMWPFLKNHLDLLPLLPFFFFFFFNITILIMVVFAAQITAILQ